MQVTQNLKSRTQETKRLGQLSVFQKVWKIHLSLIWQKVFWRNRNWWLVVTPFLVKIRGRGKFFDQKISLLWIQIKSHLLRYSNNTLESFWPHCALRQPVESARNYVEQSSQKLLHAVWLNFSRSFFLNSFMLPASKWNCETRSLLHIGRFDSNIFHIFKFWLILAFLWRCPQGWHWV